MSKQAVALRVPKIYGEKAIALSHRLQVADKELEIQKDQNFIYIPLITTPPNDILRVLERENVTYSVLTHLFPEKTRQQKTLIEILENKLTSHMLAAVPHSVDFIGDIAIVEIVSELEEHKKVIGEAILEAHKNVRVVLAKAGAVSGVYRLRNLDVIAGESRTVTAHKEYGCRYFVDVAKAYFSPRLSHEHNRVASLVRNGETVVDLFAGVGPFAVLIAKKHERVKVYAVDINPSAVEYLKRNVRLNRVEQKVHPILGDAKQIAKNELSGLADRIIMNLPEQAIDFVGAACETIRPEGGVIHFYGFVKTSDSLEGLANAFSNRIEKSGKKVNRIMLSKFVRATAPYEWQAVLDAFVS